MRIEHCVFCVSIAGWLIWFVLRQYSNDSTKFGNGIEAYAWCVYLEYFRCTYSTSFSQWWVWKNVFAHFAYDGFDILYFCSNSENATHTFHVWCHETYNQIDPIFSHFPLLSHFRHPWIIWINLHLHMQVKISQSKEFNHLHECKSILFRSWLFRWSHRVWSSFSNRSNFFVLFYYHFYLQENVFIFAVS